MYFLKIKPQLENKLKKLKKRNIKQVKIILKKVDEVLQNPNRYKNLRRPLQMWKRVHIDNSFVLTFSVDENKKIVTLEDYEHHGRIYR